VPELPERDFVPETTRRTLLYTAPGALLAARAAARPLAVGLITEPTGTHVSLFLSGLAKCPEITQVAIVDPSGKTFAQGRALLGPHAANLLTFASYEEMLRVVRPALTVVSLETYHNARVLEAVLAADSHVLSEKPPCMRLEEFEAVAKLAQARRRHLMLATVTRRNQAALKARELVDRGWIGKLYGVTMTWIGDQTRLKGPGFRNSWMASKAKAGGGKLAFHGVHYLDLIHYISGDRITRVAGFCRNVGGQPVDVEDAAVLSLQFRQGMVGTLNAGYYLDKGNSNLIHLWGELGWLRFDPFLPLEWYSTHSAAPRGVQSAPNAGPGVEYQAAVADAVRAAAGTGAPYMTTEESLAVVRVVFAGYRAAETGVAQVIA
jgi:predicted dehydrogenase